MNVELGKLACGKLVIVADKPFPHRIKNINYYRDQHLVMLVYDDPDHDGELMNYELTGPSVKIVEDSSKALVISHMTGRQVFGYDVPVAQIGG